MLSETQIEEKLVQGMRKIAVPYKKALQILRQHDADPTGSTDLPSRLKPSMEMIAQYETTVGPLRTQWNALQKTPNDALKSLVAEQSDVLQELIALLNTVEQQMAGSRSHLASRLDVSQRQNAMRQAYHG